MTLSEFLLDISSDSAKLETYRADPRAYIAGASGGPDV